MGSGRCPSGEISKFCFRWAPGEPEMILKCPDQAPGHFLKKHVLKIFCQNRSITCLPTPNHHYENDRNWILLLWTFHQNHRFCCIFTMRRATFSEQSLFHFEPSQVSFVLILSSMSGCLQARQAFMFPRKHDPAILFPLCRDDIFLSLIHI